MPINRRKMFAYAGAAVAAPALLREGHAQAAEVNLKLHHFLPAASNIHQKFLTPLVRKIEAESNGRIKITIFPAMQLGGAPPQLYDQARDGVADIVWTLPGNTPGRFPASEAMELPFVADKLGIVNARAFQEYADTYLKDEFREVQLICAWAHDAGLIHANRQVKTMEDLKGLKLRFPTRQAGEALKALGASPIGMPIPQVPESLAQKVIDGCVVPWEVVPAIKVQELLKYHTGIPGSPTLYTATFVLAMNKGSYDKMPADLKKVIDANSGMPAATMAGKTWDDAGAAVLEMVSKRSGNVISEISVDEAGRWRKTTQPVIDAWIASVKDRNLDGAKLVEAVRTLVQKYKVS